MVSDNQSANICDFRGSVARHSRKPFRSASEVFVGEDPMRQSTGAVRGLANLDADCRIVNADPAILALLGLSAGDLPIRWPGRNVCLHDQDMGPITSEDDPVVHAVVNACPARFSLLIRKTAQGSPVRLAKIRVTPQCQRSGLSTVTVTLDNALRGPAAIVVEHSDRLDALARISGTIGHDFHAILSSILPSLQLALHQTKDEDLRKLLNRALRATENGTGFGRRLMAFARPQQALIEDVPLSEVIGVVQELAAQELELCLQIHMSLKARYAMLRCDRAQLETVLLNLLFNARDAILSRSQSGRIDLRLDIQAAVERTSYIVQISVTDDGPGMSETVKARATEPFFTTRGPTGSRGLGLSIAHAFCRQAGGHLKIESSPGNGATVKLYLPVSKAANDASQEEPTNRFGSPSIRVPDNACTIFGPGRMTPQQHL